MTAWLVLLLTLTTPPTVRDADWRDVVAECRLRFSGGVPLVRVEVTTGHDVWFVLDTGATGTTMASDLVDRLGLPRSGVTAVETIEGRAAVATVRVAHLRLRGSARLHDVTAAVHDLTAVRQYAPEADGILGGDVLRAYDYLIDFDRRKLIVGRFAPPADGVRMPVTWSAGRPVLFVAGRQEVHGLVLDSGADVLVMETAAARDALGAVPATRRRASLQTHDGERPVDVEYHASLRVAHLSLTDVGLVRLPSEAWHMAPEVGLLPASYFARVYVSARTGTAVLWGK